MVRVKQRAGRDLDEEDPGPLAVLRDYRLILKVYDFDALAWVDLPA